MKSILTNTSNVYKSFEAAFNIAEDVGIKECAALVRDYFRALGCKEARIVETSGNPVVYGYYDAGADKTIIVYMMYDTQPADEHGWIVPPLRGGCGHGAFWQVSCGKGRHKHEGRACRLHKHV